MSAENRGFNSNQTINRRAFLKNLGNAGEAAILTPFVKKSLKTGSPSAINIKNHNNIEVETAAELAGFAVGGIALGPSHALERRFSRRRFNIVGGIFGALLGYMAMANFKSE